MKMFKAFGGHGTRQPVSAPVIVVVDDCTELLALMRTWDLSYAEALVELESRALDAAAYAASAGWRARVASDAGATTGDVLAVCIVLAATVATMAWMGSYLAGTVS